MVEGHVVSAPRGRSLHDGGHSEINAPSMHVTYYKCIIQLNDDDIVISCLFVFGVFLFVCLFLIVLGFDF